MKNFGKSSRDVSIVTVRTVRESRKFSGYSKVKTHVLIDDDERAACALDVLSISVQCLSNSWRYSLLELRSHVVAERSGN